MNTTSSEPAYSSFSSSRIGAIILQGMHLPAPRSRSNGSFASAAVSIAVVESAGLFGVVESGGLAGFAQGSVYLLATWPGTVCDNAAATTAISSNRSPEWQR